MLHRVIEVDIDIHDIVICDVDIHDVELLLELIWLWKFVEFLWLLNVQNCLKISDYCCNVVKIIWEICLFIKFVSHCFVVFSEKEMFYELVWILKFIFNFVNMLLKAMQLLIVILIFFLSQIEQSLSDIVNLICEIFHVKKKKANHFFSNLFHETVLNVKFSQFLFTVFKLSDCIDHSLKIIHLTDFHVRFNLWDKLIKD